MEATYGKKTPMNTSESQSRDLLATYDRALNTSVTDLAA